MDAWVWVLIAVVVLAIVAWFVWQAMQRSKASARYGPEYERTVRETGSSRQAVSELRDREKRVSDLDIRPLDPAARDRYAASWQDTQARFVDAPAEMVAEADRLVQEVMRERGYPVADFEQRAADISVDHPQLVEDYRAAHAISLASDHGQASTEDLRQAMVHYRSLFEVLLETRGSETS